MDVDVDRVLAWTRELRHFFLELVVEQRLSIGLPLIRFHKGGSQWGRWDPLERSISLSMELIDTLPWAAVVEIFKHEVAHMLVTARGLDDEPAHGAAFQAACQTLKVEPWARLAHAKVDAEELRRRFDWRLSPKSDRISAYLSRLQKLLSLANSDNEHEALLAMQRARELQAQHRLEGLAQGSAGEFVHLELGGGKKRRGVFEGQLASLLVAHFNVEVVFIRRFDPQTLARESRFDVIGRRENVVVAEYVYEFLHGSVERLWQDYRKSSAAGGARSKNSYIRGVLAGFHDKLAAERAPAPTPAVDSPNTAALIRLDQSALKQALRERYPRLRSTHSTGRVDRAVFDHGKSEGQKLNLRAGMATRATNRGHLLK